MVGLTMTASTHSISTESLLEVVADPRRRMVLHRLQETDETAVDIEELTETIVTDGGRTAGRSLSDESRALTELRHIHLPKLAEAGLIEYDQRSGAVRYCSNDRVERTLEFVSTHLE